MALAPPPNDWMDTNIDALLLRVNQHAGPEGYAVVKRRSNAFKDGVPKKVWIRCDRGGKPEKNSKSTGKRHTSSRLMDCPFQAIAQRTRVNGIQTDWTLTVTDPSHNHGRGSSIRSYRRISAHSIRPGETSGQAATTTSESSAHSNSSGETSRQADVGLQEEDLRGQGVKVELQKDIPAGAQQ